jgi:hypothetical protein
MKEGVVKKITLLVIKRSLFISFLLLLALPGAAQEERLYQMPPKEIADIVDAPGNPFVIPSPDGKNLLIVERPGCASIPAPTDRPRVARRTIKDWSSRTLLP